VQREHCDVDGADAKEILHDADSNCMHCAMQTVMVEPIGTKDILKVESNCMQSVTPEGDLNPRPHMVEPTSDDVGPSHNFCDGFWDQEVEPMDKCQEDVPPTGDKDTTHRDDISVWEDDIDPPDLMEMADDGCMRSSRQDSFDGVQLQGETPGQKEYCGMQWHNDFWLWYETKHKPQSKTGSLVKRLTKQQQKRCDFLSYSLMIIFVLSNVVLESNVASVSGS